MMSKGLPFIIFMAFILTSCVPEITRREASKSVPARFGVQSTAQSNARADTLVEVDSLSLASADTATAGRIDWRAYYADSLLVALIDTAMKNNQELNAALQEILVAGSEVDAKSGEYLPFLNLGARAEVEKSGKYTRNGAVEEQLDITPGERFPEPLPNFTIGATMSWEVDIWRKLRNAKDAAALRFLSTVEGTRLIAMNLVAELANSYYELMAMDNLLSAIDATIDIQRKALHTIEQQKLAAKATELAVRRFEAEVLKNEGKRFTILQRITEIENRINLLMGRYPQHVQRASDGFLAFAPDSVNAGIPSQLLENRPDVKKAEMELMAADLDIDVAKARFYPSLNIVAGLGISAFNPKHIVATPESMIYNLAGELMMPILNRAAIKAEYRNAGARQVQAAYDYERTVLNAYIEVANQLSKLNNLRLSYERKTAQVEALRASVDIANNLFTSARADYMEVLLTQRDALEARVELIETKVQQMQAYVDIYRALGGGWSALSR